MGLCLLRIIMGLSVQMGHAFIQIATGLELFFLDTIETKEGERNTTLTSVPSVSQTKESKPYKPCKAISMSSKNGRGNYTTISNTTSAVTDVMVALCARFQTRRVTVMDDLVDRLDAASRDETLADGTLYREAAKRIIALTVDHARYWHSIMKRTDAQADRIEQLERELGEAREDGLALVTCAICGSETATSNELAVNKRLAIAEAQLEAVKTKKSRWQADQIEQLQKQLAEDYIDNLWTTITYDPFPSH